MSRTTHTGCGVGTVPNTPSHEAVGGGSIRATTLPEEVLDVLDDLQSELGGCGRREAIAALLEFYHSQPEEVLDAEPVGGVGDCSIRARRVHKRHKKLLYDLRVESGTDTTHHALSLLCGCYRENKRSVVDRATAPHYR
jgi:hypothetical protein